MEDAQPSNGSLAHWMASIGVSAWDKLSPKQIVKVLELVAQSKMSDLDLQKIIEKNVAFTAAANSIFKAIEQINTKAGDSQKQLSDHRHDEAVSALDKLAEISTRLDSRDALEAARLISQRAKEDRESIERMNKENNNFWKMITGGLAASVILGLTIFRLTS